MSSMTATVFAGVPTLIQDSASNGIRDRVEALAGHLELGSGLDGGYRVHATPPADIEGPRDHPRAHGGRPGCRAGWLSRSGGSGQRIADDPDLQGVRVIALTTFDTDDHIFGAIKAGAAGFLLKDVDADGLHIAIRTVAAGDGVLDPAVTGRVLADLAERSARQPIAPERLDLLSDREREVLKLATKGLTNAQSRRSWS
jgi:hypothetical protein